MHVSSEHSQAAEVEHSNSSEEIDLQEMFNSSTINNTSPSQPQTNINTSNSPNNPNSINDPNAESNVLLYGIKVVIFVIFHQLQKLAITTRYVHQFLIFHFILTMIGSYITSYMTFCPLSIIENYQIWRLFSYNFSETNVFLCILGCLLLSDICKRLEYQFGSVWSLYLILTNWIFQSLFTFLFAFIYYTIEDHTQSNENTITNILNQCQCIGLYPMIMGLLIIESGLTCPYQIDHIFGIHYIPSIYHPIIYCILYNLFIRVDIAVFIAVLYNFLLIYLFPRIFHLSHHRIRQIETSKIFGYMEKDSKFVSIESIDTDSYVATGKYISVRSHNNGDSGGDNSDSNNENDTTNNNDIVMDGMGDNSHTPSASYRSTMLLRSMKRKFKKTPKMHKKNNKSDHDSYDDDNVSDSEELPFIVRTDHHNNNSGVSPISFNGNTLHVIQQKNNINMAIGNGDCDDGCNGDISAITTEDEEVSYYKSENENENELNQKTNVES